MLELREFQQSLLTHDLAPMGPIPTVHDSEGVYPYPSFAETSRRPILRPYRFITLENDLLRVTVCPDLGGKVHSIIDKRSGHEVLFIPASLQPVRILPRLGFIPGGIEVSFPISHSPVQLETVEFEARRVGDRLCVWCGERELRFGMQWTVEYSLGPGDAFLTQRTCFRNPSAKAHPWMSWSNAALPARADTEFHFPNGPVLRHDADLKTIDWDGQVPHHVADLKHMTGFFWQKPDVGAFGAFTPGLGHGLYHVADPTLVPGIKLWSYGTGRDEAWGRAASISGESYLEIQAGPDRDQSIKQVLQPGQTHAHVEFWMPASSPLDIRKIALPRPLLPPLSQVPWFDWPPRPDAWYWLAVIQAHGHGTLPELPAPPALHQNLWAPSGMDQLGGALSWATSATTGADRAAWLFQLGTWRAARGELDEAFEILARSSDDRARALLGRLQRSTKRNPRAAVESFRAITHEAFALHPQVTIERDLALAALGSETLDERAHWFARLSNSQDEWLIERRATLLLDQGRPAEAKALLERTSFQLVHQRYTRTQLWGRIDKQLGLPPQHISEALGEDDLAAFGAYREFE